MKKLVGRVLLIGLFVVFFWCGMLIADKAAVRRELIRLHVVAASDSEADQALKLRVRDAVLESLNCGMADVTDRTQAFAYLEENLTKIEKVAKEALLQQGCEDTVRVSLAEEAFPTREYETFSLPAGVYDALRIVIGEGEGQNWWCVVFPQLCIPATQAEFETSAVSSGFSTELSHTLSGENGYEFRFFLLECLGKIENFFHRG